MSFVLNLIDAVTFLAASIGSAVTVWLARELAMGAIRRWS